MTIFLLKERIVEIELSIELDKIVKTCHSEIYSDTVRDGYTCTSLLSMIVGVNNVEKVVRTVLKVDRLSKRTFSENM